MHILVLDKHTVACQRQRFLFTIRKTQTVICPDWSADGLGRILEHSLHMCAEEDLLGLICLRGAEPDLDTRWLNTNKFFSPVLFANICRAAAEGYIWHSWDVSICLLDVHRMFFARFRESLRPLTLHPLPPPRWNWQQVVLISGVIFLTNCCPSPTAGTPSPPGAMLH